MSSCKIVIGDIVYPSVENAYQAEKCLSNEHKRIISNLSPADAKLFVKNAVVIIREDFNRVCTMYSLLKQKFAISMAPPSMAALNLQVKLIETGKSPIVEVNHWHDNFWGTCKCSRCYNTPGVNMLGSMLMMIREYAK